MFKNHRTDKLCIRKTIGAILVVFGICVIATNVIYYIATQDSLPEKIDGKTLVVAGAGLLGITTLDNIKGK